VLVEFTAAAPAEAFVITPADYARWVAAWVGVTLLAVSFTAWVFWPRESGTPAPPETDSREAAETVELPRRRSGPRTGTLHGPKYRRSDDDTVVIDRSETRR
jgi:hypothetical protein